MKNINPVVYDAARKVHAPAPDGSTLMPSLVPIDPAAENMLRRTDEGISVTAAEVVSTESGNVVGVGADHKLYVRPSDMVSDADGNTLSVDVKGKLFVSGTKVISEEAGNLLEPGADGGVKLTADLLISDDADNQIGLGKDKKLFVSPTTVVSEDEGNLLVRGNDGGAKLEVTGIVSSKSGNRLTLDDSKKLYVIGISTEDGNLLRTGEDGGIYLDVPMLLSTQGGMNPLGTDTDGKLLLNPCMLPKTPNVVSVADGNLIESDRVDGSAYLGFDNLVSEQKGNLIEQDSEGRLLVSAAGAVSSDAGNLLGTDASGAIKLTAYDLISSDDCNLIQRTADGKVGLCLGLSYNAINGTLELRDTNNAPVASVTVPSATSMLQTVLLESNPLGQPEGIYLKLGFKLADGSVETIYVDMTSLEDVYTAGRGIDITDRNISLKLAVGSGLSFDANGALRADFGSLSGSGLGLEQDPESLGFRYAVLIGSGLDYGTRFVPDPYDPTGPNIEVSYLMAKLDQNQSFVFFKTAADGEYDEISAFLGLRVGGSGEGSYLEFYDHNGAGLSGSRITLGNGLASNGASGLTIVTEATLSDSAKPISAGAVKSAVDDLQKAIDEGLAGLGSSSDAGLAALNSALQQEIKDRANGDNTLAAKLQQEAATRAADDNALSARIDAIRDEIGDNIKTQLAAEIAAREAGDAALNDAVDAANDALAAEIAAREAGDTTLQNNLDAAVAELTARFKDWLLTTGGTMTGDIDMSNNNLLNVASLTSTGAMNIAAAGGIQVNGQDRITFSNGTAIWVE